MGKLMIQNRQMFESHPECFPRMAKMKGTPTTQQSATTK
jgi:hypothetical protein